ncbi:MAG: hypothetical protein LQ340_000154 [Diploschistes diacapsis]|nr:MAG: hypothetical protein LQ340_000154 [Diploschistes diacapsis]
MLRSFWTQWFPPPPNFTEKDVPRQDGKVFIVTGGNSGIGLELIKILYPTGATIYMASRSEERAKAAIQSVVAGKPTPPKPGALKYLHLDLDDLSTISATAASFAAQESRLDILWNNAGVGGVPVGTSTKQHLEGHIGVNCVAPLFLTQQLIRHMQEAAASHPGSVRIVWTASLSIETHAPANGVDLSLADAGRTQNPPRDYAASKAGNWLLAVEGAKRYGGDGIISVAQNPGQLDTEVWRHQSSLLMMFMRPSLHPVKMGAYTMLYAGLSPEINADSNGAYVMPWGRVMEGGPRKDVSNAIEEGHATKFWEWCERKCEPFNESRGLR